ncbi:thiamine pyrophosphate-dependent dehydrogenase E1 component subunit alpha [Demequina muriae]|uniref:2-oxoisovalerate dehydrogenase subunit alpha n=1 Tax=Demequina muriae TaxID=3051664 RepID=A0ABT8GGM7_9MICO|nr:thiamine pyrophosphate-dependent dehydrogenase E1 component subunit alpha [Demequina sp. EGI L300058]MDN4480426.1 thiamine pyrophosphate-dependent dehydrogenase E1 component subunit alpha [Demequina sp. EGI L300058]
MDAVGPLSSEGLVQLLTHTGEPVENETFSPYAAHLSADDLRAFWRDMTVLRAFDLEATSLQRQGELGLWVQSLGQEGAQIGSGHALREPDFVFPSYREHGVALTRDVDLVDVLKIFRGLQHGAWNPKDHGFHLYTLVIGSHALHATGYAMALDRDGLVASGDPDRDGAAVCYFGDGATSQGDVSEALTFASVYNAPVVFFVQNNQFAISEPATRQSKVPLADRGKGFGIPTVRVDGNDVIACHAVTQWAVRHARSGGGPVFIEAFTYRMGAHTTSDDPSRYRSKAQESYWAERDPISRLEAYLTNRGELSAEFRAEVEAEAKALCERARTAVRSWEREPLLTMFDDVYALPHATVEAERAWFERYEASFADGETAAEGKAH